MGVCIFFHINNQLADNKQLGTNNSGQCEALPGAQGLTFFPTSYRAQSHKTAPLQIPAANGQPRLPTLLPDWLQIWGPTSPPQVW